MYVLLLFQWNCGKWRKKRGRVLENVEESEKWRGNSKLWQFKKNIFQFSSKLHFLSVVSLKIKKYSTLSLSLWKMSQAFHSPNYYSYFMVKWNVNLFSQLATQCNHPGKLHTWSYKRDFFRNLKKNFLCEKEYYLGEMSFYQASPLWL